MKIKIGEANVNKTWKYLSPCLQGHGGILFSYLNQIFKLGLGIHDTLLDGADVTKERVIYILVDTGVNNKVFVTLYNFIKTEDYFVHGYCPDSEISNSRKFMIVLKVPEAYYDAYDHFLKGEYSKMYTQEQLDLLFTDSTIHHKNVLLKQNAQGMLDKIKNRFNEDLTLNDIEDHEHELPLEAEEEIFHYNKNTVFFTDKLFQKQEL